MKDVELDDDFRQEVKALSKTERGIIGQAMADIQEASEIPTFIRESAFEN